MASDDWTPVDEQQPAGGWLDTANDFGRAVSNAATFGMANRAKAYIEYLKGNTPSYGEGVDQQAKASEVARERSPYASIAGDIYGSFAIPSLGAGGLATRMGGGALARAGAYGATGAVTGAAQGAGGTYSGELPDYIRNAVVGGALGGAFGSAGGAAFGRRPATSAAAVPTQAELWAAKNTGYGALGRSGARYEQSALRDIANQTEQNLLADRYHWRDSPATWRAIEEARGGGAPGQLNTGFGAPVDPGNIDFIVKGLNRIPKTEATLTDRESARIVKNAFNNFVENPPPGAVLPGTEQAARQASTLARNARGDYGGYKRVQKINELIHNAADTTGATHSGLNLQNELRKGVRTFVKEKAGESPASKSGFNQAEREALSGYTRGTNATNLLRGASNMLGGGGGLASHISLATGVGGGGLLGQYFKDDPVTGAVAGTLPVATGFALRAIGNRRANADIAAMRDMIARRTPLYNYRTSMAGTLPGPGSPQTAKALRDTVALELLKQQTRPEQKYESW